MKNTSDRTGRTMSAIAGMKIATGALMLAACAPGGGGGMMKMPVGKVADPGLEVSAYFFAAPDDFLFVDGQTQPGVAGTYPREVGERLVKSLSKRRGFALSGDAPARSREAEGKLKEVREFAYPSEYEPPVAEARGEGEWSLVRPATPVKVESRELGVVLGYSVRERGDGQVEVHLDLKRSVFLGFVNYGAPITATRRGWFGRQVEVTLSENRIEMPVIDQKEARAGILMKDGDFIAVGGFLPEARAKGPNFSPWKGPGGGAGHNFVALVQVKSSD